MSDPEKDSASLSLPRILCLHGGGVNAQVFRLQCRSIIRSGLTPYFRFVFVDGPFPCHAHPAIVPVYGGYGPFYRWLRWMDDHEAVDAEEVSEKVLESIRGGMRDDEGTGEWVGVLGFSQGAKIAGSLLWTQESLKRGGEKPLLVDGGRGVNFRFAVLMAGSAPTVMLDPVGRLEVPRFVETADKTSLSFADWPPGNEGEHAIGLPTLHVHGLKDPGIERHRKLLELYCKRGTTRLVEWEGDHRLPVKSVDVDLVVAKVMEMAWETGVVDHF